MTSKTADCGLYILAMVLLKKSIQTSVATLASIPLAVNMFLLSMKQYSQTCIYKTATLGTT